MRVYWDLELVEQLGSGVPRILESYGRECFRFMDNFIRMTFPASEEVVPQSGLVDGLVESQRKIVELVKANPKISKKEMSKSIGISTTAVSVRRTTCLISEDYSESSADRDPSGFCD